MIDYTRLSKLKMLEKFVFIFFSFFSLFNLREFCLRLSRGFHRL